MHPRLGLLCSGKPSQRTLLLWETRNRLSCTGESTYLTRGGQGVEALSGISPSSPWRQGRTPGGLKGHVAGYVSLQGCAPATAGTQSLILRSLPQVVQRGKRSEPAHKLWNEVSC